MQNQEQLMMEATRQVLDAYDKEQFQAIPYIISGWTTALLGDCMMSRVLGFDPEPYANAGDTIMASPTRITQVAKEGIVPSLKMVCRPAISLRTRPDAERIESMLTAMQVGVDRLFWNAVNQKGMVMSFEGYCAAAERFEEEDGGIGNRFAFAGYNVSREFAHHHAYEGQAEHSAREARVLPEDTLVLARFSTQAALGVYCISPVRVEVAPGLDADKYPPIKIVYDDKDERVLRHNPDLSDRLEFSMVIDVAACIAQPERFLIINNCATEPEHEQEESQAGYVPGSSTTH